MGTRKRNKHGGGKQEGGAANPSLSKKTSPTTTAKTLSATELFWLLLRLGRIKFLYYSIALHACGILLFWTMQHQQQLPLNFDWSLALLLQYTISTTHVMTHYFNEHADYEVDKLNENAGAWTGGSKVLAKGWLPRKAALIMGWLLLIFGSVFGGVATIARYIYVHHDGVIAWSSIPWDFVLMGISVAFVSVAYSVPPFRLCARGLGELCVSYVLTFGTPVVGFVVQGGVLNSWFFIVLLPVFIVNAARMVVMNIPDREGDAKGDKITSVVLIGEEKAVSLTNLVYLATYLYIIPNLPGLSMNIRFGYLAMVPFRFWQSLYLNQKEWWKIPDQTDSLPFWESMFILFTVICLNSAIALDLYEQGAFA